MRTKDEVQDFLNRTYISVTEVPAIKRWFSTIPFGDLEIPKTTICGATLIDVIDFVNSPSPSKEKDFSPIVAQFAKVKKEVDKLQKLIQKL